VLETVILRLIDRLIELRFYVPFDKNISWLSTEETETNATKANNTGIKWQKYTDTKIKPKSKEYLN